MSIPKETLERINKLSADLVAVHVEHEDYERRYTAETEDGKPPAVWLIVTHEEMNLVFSRRMRAIEAELRDVGVGAVVKVSGDAVEAQERARVESLGKK